MLCNPDATIEFCGVTSWKSGRLGRGSCPARSAWLDCPSPVMNVPIVDTLEQLAFVARQLAAVDPKALSAGERALAARAVAVAPDRVAACRDAIVEGRDPFGETFSLLKGPVARRALGAT